MQRAALAVAMAVAALAWAPCASAQSNKTEEIVARAVAYTVDFVSHFASVVAEERYVQDARRVAAAGGKGTVLQGALHRELVSDFLLVKIPAMGELLTFRDVREVDGRPVGDRQDRLTTLFMQPWATALQQAKQIDREGIRYNLGDDTRSVNNPLVALGFLQPSYQRHFRFSLRDADKEAGPDVWIVEFREQTRPTLLRSVPDGDVVAGGRFWIERQTGRVVRTELTLSDSDTITTSFRFDDRLQINVPSEMRESYFYRGQYVSGVATYDNFRRFDVTTEEKLK